MQSFTDTHPGTGPADDSSSPIAAGPAAGDPVFATPLGPATEHVSTEDRAVYLTFFGEYEGQFSATPGMRTNSGRGAFSLKLSLDDAGVLRPFLYIQARPTILVKTFPIEVMRSGELFASITMRSNRDTPQEFFGRIDTSTRPWQITGHWMNTRSVTFGGIVFGVGEMTLTGVATS